MSVSAKSLGIDQLDIDDRLALVEEIWGTICADAKTFPLSDAQRAELDRRVADDDAFPADLVPWDEVKATVRARLTRSRCASPSGTLRKASMQMPLPGMTSSARVSAKSFFTKLNRR